MPTVNDPPNGKSHQCLPEGRLQAYLQGQLSSAEIERVAAETEACQNCQRTMDQLEAGQDQLLDAVRDGENLPAWEDPDELADLLAAAELAHAESRSESSDSTANNRKPLGESQRVGQYLLLQPLGQGGMGTVWRAEHADLRRVVALKMLSEHRPQSASAKARFRREIQAIGRLQHANIVQALDAGEVDGRLFLAMELLPGVDAAQQVRQHGPLPVAAACQIVRQACLGIDYAHKQGLLHRDVKPSNVMLLPDGPVKVLDLGLARFAQSDDVTDDSLTSESQVLGTGDFVAPEQGLDPRAADERSDIYALGGTLYFLLTGEAPFASPGSDTFAKKVMAHAHEPAPSAAALCGEVPQELDAVIKRCLAKLPDERFSSAAELADELAPFCTAGAPHEKPNRLPAATLASIMPRRSVSPWLVVGATALVMLIAFGITWAAFPNWMLVGKVSGDNEVSDGTPPTAPVHDGGTPAFREAPVEPATMPNEAITSPPTAGGRAVRLDWIYTEHTGQKRDPSGVLIHGQGFCFLSGVQGKFHGWADKVNVDVNRDNVWGVSGAGVEFGVDIKARGFSVETRQPKPISVGVNTFRWSPPADGVRMLHKDEGLCVLTSFGGALKADDDFVGIELGEDGYYWLRGKSQDTGSTAMATSVLLSRERSLDAKVITYRWPSEMHRQPIRMIHSDEGICFLSLIRGRYSTPEDSARVYIDVKDGYWYLSGGGSESPVSAEAIAVQFAK